MPLYSSNVIRFVDKLRRREKGQLPTKEKLESDVKIIYWKRGTLNAMLSCALPIPGKRHETTVHKDKVR